MLEKYNAVVFLHKLMGRKPYEMIWEPQFVNKSAFNAPGLHLSGSDLVARNAGVSLSNLFTIDIDNETRDAIWDIGADEFVGGGGPSAPSNLRVTP